MRIRLAGFFTLGVLGALIGACAARTPSYDVISFCTDSAQARCQIAGTCSVDAFACQAFQFKQCTTDAQLATGANTRVFNSDNAAACVQALQNLFGSNTTAVGFAQIQSVNDTCARVYAGTGNAGAFCRLEYDCVNGLVCAPKTPGGTPSVCAAPQPVQQGQSCAAIGSQCPADTYCAQQNGNAPQCASCPGAGEPCAEQEYCMSAQRCVRGTCVDRGGAGTPCVPGQDDCAADNPYCDPYSSQCTPGMTFQPNSVDCLGVAGLRATPVADAAVDGSGDDSGM
jgi:hypothetical protein